MSEPRPRDVHCRLQELVDEHFGYRPTTPIEGLLTILETELGGAIGPELVSTPNADSGDYTVTCSGCGEEMDQRHTWKECHEALKEEREVLDGAWWGVLGILMDVAPHASSPEEAARSAASRLALIEAKDTAYPLTEILRRLADAADHLLGDHSCDAHGYEGLGLARDAARRILAGLAHADETGGTP